MAELSENNADQQESGSYNAASGKTTKELAFLHELFVATDWGERFAELIDENLDLSTRKATGWSLR